MNGFIEKLALAAVALALAGAAGSVDAQTNENPRTNDSWYNTYAEDAINRAAKRETIIIEDRGLYAPLRLYGYNRKRHFKKYRDRRHDRAGSRREIRRHGRVGRHGRRGFAYNPRAAILRSGVGR